MDRVTLYCGPTRRNTLFGGALIALCMVSSNASAGLLSAFAFSQDGFVVESVAPRNQGMSAPRPETDESPEPDGPSVDEPVKRRGLPGPESSSNAGSGSGGGQSAVAALEVSDDDSASICYWIRQGSSAMRSPPDEMGLFRPPRVFLHFS